MIRNLGAVNEVETSAAKRVKLVRTRSRYCCVGLRVRGDGTGVAGRWTRSYSYRQENGALISVSAWGREQSMASNAKASPVRFQDCLLAAVSI